MENALKALGLTDGEIHVYLALVKIGTSFVNDIADASSKSRPHVYEILKALQEKGLVIRSMKGGQVSYTAAPPSKLVLLANEKVRAFQDVEKEIAIKLPDLQSQYHTAYGSRIRVYEGWEDMKEVFDDIMTAKTDLLVIGSSDEIEKYIQEYPEYVSQRVEKRIKARMLMAKTPAIARMKERAERELRDIRFIPPLPTLTYVYDDKTVICMTENTMVTALFIESKKISSTCRALFEFMWLTASAE